MRRRNQLDVLQERVPGTPPLGKQMRSRIQVQAKKEKFEFSG